MKLIIHRHIIEIDPDNRGESVLVKISNENKECMSFYASRAEARTLATALSESVKPQ